MIDTDKFEWFESGNALKGVNFGAVDPSVYQKYIRYKVYLDFRSQGFDIEQAMKETAKRNRCSSVTVFRDRAFFHDGERLRDKNSKKLAVNLLVDKTK